MLKTAALVILSVWLSLLNTQCNAQGIRSYPDYKCDNAGELGGLRLQRTLDYSVCRSRHPHYCSSCRCEWAAYYEIAQYCFPIDEQYKIRVLRDRDDFDANFKEYCVPLTEDVSTFVIPIHTTDPNGEHYCGNSSRSQLEVFHVAIVLLTLLIQAY